MSKKFLKGLTLFSLGAFLAIFIYNTALSYKLSHLNLDFSKYIADNVKQDEFIYEKQDYLFAGLMLDENFRNDSKDFFNKNIETNLNYDNYISSEINPIYKNYLKTKLQELNTEELLNFIKDNVKIKLADLKKIISSKVKINLNKLISNLNTKISILKDELKNLEEIIKFKINNMSNDIKQKIKAQLSKLNIKISDLKVKLSNLQKELTKIQEQLLEMKNNLNYLFSSVDDDYNFSTININGNTIDVSFLNILDLNIDLSTTQYINNSTPFNLDDDTLIIYDIYINLEALEGLGIDIVIGQININGPLALLIYNSIGVINEQI